MSIFVLLSHAHWDHVQGFPFFCPLYEQGRQIWMFPTRQGHTQLCSLIEQMDGAHFPVTPERLPGRPECVLDDATEFLSRPGFAVARIPTNHPGGGYGYRIGHDSKSVVYLTDNELDPPTRKRPSWRTSSASAVAWTS